MTIVIEHHDQLGGAPRGLYRLVIDAHHWMMSVDLADAFGVPWDYRAVVAIEDEIIVGFIAYSRVEWIKQVNINIGWVECAHRCKGIYRQMWDALVEKSRADGYREIFGITKVDNIAMREVAAKLGRVEESINLRYVL